MHEIIAAVQSERGAAMSRSAIGFGFHMCAGGAAGTGGQCGIGEVADGQGFPCALRPPL